MSAVNFNYFMFGFLLGTIIVFISGELDNKRMIEQGYIHNCFLGKVYINKESKWVQLILKY